jgi:hypothetical protein
VLADQHHGPAVVLSGRKEPIDETPFRLAWAQQHCETVLLFDGAHTQDEAHLALAQAGTDLTIVTSAYHALRAFLTFVQVSGTTPLKLWNLPVPSSMDRLADELQKIERYQQAGHVASYERGVQYWRWRNGN